LAQKRKGSFGREHGLKNKGENGIGARFRCVQASKTEQPRAPGENDRGRALWQERLGGPKKKIRRRFHRARPGVLGSPGGVFFHYATRGPRGTQREMRTIVLGETRPIEQRQVPWRRVGGKPIFLMRRLSVTKRKNPFAAFLLPHSGGDPPRGEQKPRPGGGGTSVCGNQCGPEGTAGRCRAAAFVYAEKGVLEAAGGPPSNLKG